ncbi:hypothetical protein Ahy_A06g027579 [Arachis hypogaea]|uniref:Uncharacterized protein n=1 Tax=Arachis hypogaea TaxID=3818 RepID=A0A445CP31_ARAHY|nr:hypothetical protein Ahy_A06g027579 [Arachis hypogaea]
MFTRIFGKPKQEANTLTTLDKLTEFLNDSIIKKNGSSLSIRLISQSIYLLVWKWASIGYSGLRLAMMGQSDWAPILTMECSIGFAFFFSKKGFSEVSGSGGVGSYEHIHCRDCGPPHSDG